MHACRAAPISAPMSSNTPPTPLLVAHACVQGHQEGAAGSDQPAACDQLSDNRATAVTEVRWGTLLRPRSLTGQHRSWIAFDMYMAVLSCPLPVIALPLSTTTAPIHWWCPMHQQAPRHGRHRGSARGNPVSSWYGSSELPGAGARRPSGELRAAPATHPNACPKLKPKP